MLSPIFHALATLVAVCYSIVPSYGLAITLMTVVVMVVLAPLTWKGTRSMLEMQRLQPEIKKIQERHKDDRQKANEEMMAFYKEHKINPVGGCLPMFVQMPVFFIMYRVIRGLAHTVIAGALFSGSASATPALANATLQNARITGGTVVAGDVATGTLSATVVVDDRPVGTISKVAIKNGVVAAAAVAPLGGKTGGAKAPAIGTLTDLKVTGGTVIGEPSYIPHSSKLYKSLHASHGTIRSFGIDLAKSVSDLMGKVGFLTLLPLLVLLVLVVVTQYIQTKQMSGRNAASQTPQMQMMQRITPLLFGYFSFIVPAGLNVYFLVSAVFRIGQQELMYRYDPILKQHVAAQAKEIEAKAYDTKGFVPKHVNGKNGKNAKPGKSGKAGNKPPRPANKRKKGR